MTKIIYWLCALLCSGLLLVACFEKQTQTNVTKMLQQYNDKLEVVSTDVKDLLSLIERNAQKNELQKQFKKARVSYKKVEWLAEYYYPYSAKKINGPAIDEVEADEKSIIVKAEGFQVIEEIIFSAGDDYNKADLFQQAKVLQSNIGRLSYMISLQETTDAHIFDALRLEIFRIIALGISGFDSPIANNSLDETAAALESVGKVLALYSTQKNPVDKNLDRLLNSSIQFISSAKDFNSFDRMKFITQFLNPVSEDLLHVQNVLKIPVFTEPRVLSPGAKSLFSKNIFNPDFFTANTSSYSSPEKIKLGEQLFYDGILSGDGKRSCATCHQPGRAFSDGLTTSLAVKGKSSVRRNSPTLINAALQPSLFYDTRVNYLEDQAKDVISNKDEMHGSLEAAVKYLNNDSVYRKLFGKVYKDEKITDQHIKNSLAAYVRSLVKLNSRFDQYMRGNHAVMNQIEIDGFNVFTGKAKCGTCHFVPLFNGANPPLFNKIDSEIIGVPANADSLHPVLDIDLGKYNLYKIDLQKHAFKTPTLRNIDLTAPYMHNGVFKTLEEVIEFYNRGGGSGLGFDLENQTLSEDRLELTTYEKNALIAFMKTLSDTTSTGNIETSF